MKNTPLRKPRPAHPSKNPYKRRSWETDEDYNDRISQINAKSQKDLEAEIMSVQQKILKRNNYDTDRKS